MFNKTEIVENKGRGIFRKRNESLVVPVNSNKQVVKPKVESASQTARSMDDNESVFTSRTKIGRVKPATAPATPPLKKRSPISACPPTAISRSSLKFGAIPVYNRNKTFGSKYLVTEQMQLAKKQFNQIRKELAELQNKAIDSYKRYRDSFVKFNRCNGNEYPPIIEELQIVEFKEQAIDISPPPNVASTTNVKLAANFSFSQMKQITDENILSGISKQVHEIQAKGFKLLKEFSDRLTSIISSTKIAEHSEGGDTNSVPEKIQNLYKELESKIFDEEKQQEAHIITFMDNLKQIMINEEGVPVLTNDGIWEEYANYRKLSERKINDLETKIKELETKRNHEECKSVELTTTITDENTNINQLNAALTESLAKRNDRKKEFDKIVLKLQHVELANKRLERQLEDKALEVLAKDKSIVELQISIRSMQTKLTKYTNQIENLKSNLDHIEEDNNIQIDRLKMEYAREMKICDALRKQINDLNLGIADESKAIQDENIKLKNNENELRNEIDSLKRSLHETNGALKSEENKVTRDIERQDEELSRLRALIIEMKKELFKRDNLVAKKNREINGLENEIHELENRDKMNEFQREIVKLQELNNQKAKEVDHLKTELNKTEAAFRLQGELEQQRLSKIRSLHENEELIKNRISNLNLEVEKRSYALQQLNQEVSSKTEELQNLFSTLGAKNLEVQRQDQIIKMLVETHEKLQAKQEDKIARLEQENAKFKSFM